MNQEINEIYTNLVSEGTEIDGKITFQHVTRVHGVLTGQVFSKDDSTLIIGETGVVEGNIEADTLIVDGFVRGDIKALTKVVISNSGRVIGNVETGSLIVEFGAYFEGKCRMEEDAAATRKFTKGLELSPV